jgi:hypothetical protein
MPIKSALQFFPEEFDQIVEHTRKNGKHARDAHAMRLEPAK